MNGAQRYNYEQLREQVNTELLNKNMPQRLYGSTDGIFRMINAIVKTKGEGWAAQAVNNDGNPLLTQEEQQKFTQALEPYLGTITEYFGNLDENMEGGALYRPDIAALSGMSKNYLKSKMTQVTGLAAGENLIGPDDIYKKIIQKVDSIDSTVNDFASKYGVLRLEKEHDLEPDPRLIPEPAALAISEGIFGLTGTPPNITMDILSKVKIPFRTIVYIIFLALDVTRIAMSVTDRPGARKLLSIILSILELLRGDWKKSILTIIGFFGNTPLLAGEVLKAFLTLFRKLSPQLQENIIYGAYDASKSLMIGTLLSTFQVTAPEEVRLPLIGALEKVAKRKAEIDGLLVNEGLSARPAFLSPTFEDLNNIQAVMTDKAYVCSCEFEQLINAVNKSSLITTIFQLLSIPTTRDDKCETPCKDFVQLVVGESMEDKEEQNRLEGNPQSTAVAPQNISTEAQVPLASPIASPLTAAINEKTKQLQEVANEATKAQQALTEVVSNPGKAASKAASSAQTGALTKALKPKQNGGGRILHSRQRIIA